MFVRVFIFFKMYIFVNYVLKISTHSTTFHTNFMYVFVRVERETREKKFKF